PQHLADKLPHLAQGMVCANALLRPDMREHSALIEKSSAHRKSSRRISGKSESTPLRFGEIFQQTARPTAHPFHMKTATVFEPVIWTPRAWNGARPSRRRRG